MKQYPRAWYENHKLRGWFTALFGGAFTLVQWRLGYFLNLWLSITAVAGFVAGRVYDNYTTVGVFSLKPWFDRQGKEFPIIEGNRFLSNYPTIKELVFSSGTLVSIAALPLTFVLPGVGVAELLGGLLVGLNNWRNRQRLLWMMQEG